MATVQDVRVPDIGDFKDAPVIEVLVKPGHRVAKEQSLITLESDKATMDVPSPLAGIVKEVKVKVGDKVSQGTPVVALEAEDAPAAEKKPAAPERAATPERPAAPEQSAADSRAPAAAPVEHAT